MTINEEKCETQYETVFEDECTGGSGAAPTECTTVREEQCNTVQKQECTTQNEQVSFFLWIGMS